MDIGNNGKEITGNGGKFTNMKNKIIRTKPDKVGHPSFKLSVWFDGKRTYLRFSMNLSENSDDFWGCLSGQKLYRLARAIVRNFEEDK